MSKRRVYVPFSLSKLKSVFMCLLVYRRSYSYSKTVQTSKSTGWFPTDCTYFWCSWDIPGQWKNQYINWTIQRNYQDTGPCYFLTKIDSPPYLSNHFIKLYTLVAEFSNVYWVSMSPLSTNIELKICEWHLSVDVRDFNLVGLKMDYYVKK